MFQWKRAGHHSSGREQGTPPVEESRAPLRRPTCCSGCLAWSPMLTVLTGLCPLTNNQCVTYPPCTYLPSLHLPSLHLHTLQVPSVQLPSSHLPSSHLPSSHLPSLNLPSSPIPRTPGRPTLSYRPVADTFRPTDLIRPAEATLILLWAS